MSLISGHEALAIFRSIGSTAPPAPPIPPAMRKPDASSDEIPRRRPRTDGWELQAAWPGGSSWINWGLRLTVLSAVDIADEPAPGPQWHVSVGAFGPGHGHPRRVASDEAIARVREDFDMQLAEEDNHVPDGKIRNLWLPVRPALVGVPCPCKAAEEPHEGEGGYFWRDAPAGD